MKTTTKHHSQQLTALLKAKKPSTIGEELILPATKDICSELFREEANKKVRNIPNGSDEKTNIAYFCVIYFSARYAQGFATCIVFAN